MIWNTLVKTYDLYSDLAGVRQEGQPTLLPIFHSTLCAQVEVEIDGNGNFLSSRKVDKEDATTIMPINEASASRTADNSPHPLCDKLCYVAGDYSKYTGDHKEDYFKKYLKQLKDWVESKYTHPLIHAVYQYVSGGTLITDLVRNGTMVLDEKGALDSKTKIQALAQSVASIRFVVSGLDESIEPAVWKNMELYRLYIQYYTELIYGKGEKDLCYVTGEMMPNTYKHPTKIRNSSDGAKLISAQDTDNFTFLGNFTSKEQVVSVGFETSQKFHNALRWLIQRQGTHIDGTVTVCWMLNRHIPMLDIMKDSVNAYRAIDVFDPSDIHTDDSENPETDEELQYAEQFRKAIRGYAGKITENDKVAIVSMDAATKGRLSIIYYDEMGGKQYISAIQNWQEHCKWRRTVRLEGADDDRKYVTLECTPSPKDMVLAAYGVQKSGWLEADDRLVSSSIRRLLPCITNPNMKIPADIVRAVATRASKPESMSDYVWKNDVLSVACAMIRYNYEKDGKSMETFLEDNVKNRNVLWGRLWAVCDLMEERALFERDENGNPVKARATNAKRYWNSFSHTPSRTYDIVSRKLKPYERKLRRQELIMFTDWMQEIVNQLAELNEFGTNRALSEEYLPGYYLQRESMVTQLKELYTKKAKEN